VSLNVCTTSAAAIARGLDRCARRSGSGWLVLCPVHEDRRPSLSIRDLNGRVLVHCFAGCTGSSVIEALRQRGLWPNHSAEPRTPEDREDWARRRRFVEGHLSQALLWQRSVVGLTNELLYTLKQSLLTTSPLILAVPGEIFFWEQLLSTTFRLRDAELVDEYCRWRKSNPKLTRALVSIGDDREHSERVALLELIGSWRDATA
jgi:hypothetical protein